MRRLMLWLVLCSGGQQELGPTATRPLARPQVLGKVQRKWVIDTDTVFVLDGKLVYGFRDLPMGAVVIEIIVGNDGRVERMAFELGK